MQQESGRGDSAESSLGRGSAGAWEGEKGKRGRGEEAEAEGKGWGKRRRRREGRRGTSQSSSWRPEGDQLGDGDSIPSLSLSA